MAAKRVKLTNDAVGNSNDVVYYKASVTGEVTADATHPLFVAERAGFVVSCTGGVLENGSDATNPLTMTFTPKKNATAVCSTDAAIAKTAASDSTAGTASAGTGITQAVIKTDGSATFAANDVFSVVFDITRTASPTTEITSPMFIIGVVYTATDPSGLPDASTGAAGNV